MSFPWLVSAIAKWSWENMYLLWRASGKMLSLCLAPAEILFWNMLQKSNILVARSVLRNSHLKKIFLSQDYFSMLTFLIKQNWKECRISFTCCWITSMLFKLLNHSLGILESSLTMVHIHNLIILLFTQIHLSLHKIE